MQGPQCGVGAKPAERSGGRVFKMSQDAQPNGVALQGHTRARPHCVPLQAARARDKAAVQLRGELQAQQLLAGGAAMEAAGCSGRQCCSRCKEEHGAHNGLGGRGAQLAGCRAAQALAVARPGLFCNRPYTLPRMLQPLLGVQGRPRASTYGLATHNGQLAGGAALPRHRGRHLRPSAARGEAAGAGTAGAHCAAACEASKGGTGTAGTAGAAAGTAGPAAGAAGSTAAGAAGTGGVRPLGQQAGSLAAWAGPSSACPLARSPACARGDQRGCYFAFGLDGRASRQPGGNSPPQRGPAAGCWHQLPAHAAASGAGVGTEVGCSLEGSYLEQEETQ